MRMRIGVLAMVCLLPLLGGAQKAGLAQKSVLVLRASLEQRASLVQRASLGKREWRAATPAELEAVLPARATVEKERIETEMRSASGVIDAHGKMVAAVVLITAGYAANGKYSYYLLVQSPVRIGTDILLPAGNYAVGWTRAQDGLLVKFYEAETGVERGSIVAHPLTQPLPIVSVKIWPPSEHGVIQIGRFALPYSLDE